MRFCPKCGAQVGDTDSFCGKCGCDLRETGSSGVTVEVESRQETHVNWFLVIAVAAILVTASVGGIYILTRDTSFSGKDAEVTFSWDGGEKHYSYTMVIPHSDISKMRSSDIDRSGSVSSDDYKYKDSGEMVYGVRDYIVVDGNIRSLVNGLRMYYDNDYPDGDGPEFAQFLAWFVQNAVDYRSDETKGSSEYWKYPLETLCDKAGDCEDGSILLASMLYAAGYDAGIYLLPSHAMAAVSAESVEKEYENERFGYYPIETALSAHSETWDIGKVMEGYDHVYYHLYTGYSIEYV